MSGRFRAATFGEVNILLDILNRDIEALKARVQSLEEDGRPLGWELTAEAKRAHDDEQAVGGSAPTVDDLLVPENIHEYSPEASDGD